VRGRVSTTYTHGCDADHRRSPPRTGAYCRGSRI